MERSLARTSIEQLRAGVPSRMAADVLSAGRGRIMADIAEDLRSVQEGRVRRSMRIVAANYGDGKSHMLQAVRNLAEGERFLTSVLTVSRESPLDRVDRVYRKLVTGTFFPGVDRPGLDPLWQAIERSGEASERLLRIAQTRLHPKLAAVLEARFDGARGDPDPLDRDLAGYLLALPDLRRAYLDNTGRKLGQIERFKLDASFDYLRLVAEAAAIAGLSGWVILIDEAEMIGSVGRRARARSYDFLGRLQDAKALPRTYSVVAVAASFQQTLADPLQETTDLPLWLVERGDGELAGRIEGPIRQLQGAPNLPPLTESDLGQVFDGIVRLHAEAFGWSPPLDGKALLTRIRVPLRERDIKVRQMVRAAVHFLDLYRVYGVEPELRVHGLAEPVMVPEAEAVSEAAATAEPPDGGPVRRDWDV